MKRGVAAPMAATKKTIPHPRETGIFDSRSGLPRGFNNLQGMSKPLLQFIPLLTPRNEYILFFEEDWLMQEISMKQGMNMDQKRCEI